MLQGERHVTGFNLDTFYPEFTFSVSQKGERQFPRNSGYEYSSVRMFLIKDGKSEPPIFIKGSYTIK
jgi:hypothetical protein